MKEQPFSSIYAFAFQSKRAILFCLALSFLAFCSMSSCKSQKDINVDVNTLTQVAEIYKSRCYGRCPDFTMKVYNNGYAEYEGRSNVDKNGTYSKVFKESDIEEMLSLCKDAGFWDLDDNYEKKVMDVPSKYISLLSDGRMKKVRCNIQLPDAYKAAEKALDAMADSEGWKLISPGSNAK